MSRMSQYRTAICPLCPQYSPLVEIDQEDNVIPEACHSMCSGHCDDECKQVVDEGVEGLVHESTPEEVKKKITT